MFISVWQARLVGITGLEDKYHLCFICALKGKGLNLSRAESDPLPRYKLKCQRSVQKELSANCIFIITFAVIFTHRCGIFKCHTYKSKYKKVGVLPIRRVTSNVLSVGPSSEKNMRTVSGSDEGPTLETLEFTIRIGNIPTFSHFDLYLYAAHYVYLNVIG